MSNYPSGTSKVNRFTQDDYHLWYMLRFREGVSVKDIAIKFECSYVHVRQTTTRMQQTGYEEVLFDG